MSARVYPLPAEAADQAFPLAGVWAYGMTTLGLPRPVNGDLKRLEQVARDFLVGPAPVVAPVVDDGESPGLPVAEIGACPRCRSTASLTNLGVEGLRRTLRCSRCDRTFTAPLVAFIATSTALGDDEIKAVARDAKARGLAVVVADDVDPSHPGECPRGTRTDGHPPVCWTAATLRALAKCDVLIVLPGWQDSPVVRRQVDQADEFGLTIEFVEPAGEAVPA